jgi:hypothetical protein
VTKDSSQFKKPYYEADKTVPRESAMPEFMAYELFGRWIPESPDTLALEQLGNRCAAAWASGHLGAWAKRVVTALELLCSVPANDTSKLVEIVLETVQSYFAPQKSLYFTVKDRKEKEQAAEAEERFPALFQEYHNKLENVYRHLGTIFSFAKDAVFSNAHAMNSASWWLQQSAKTKLSKLDSPLVLGSCPLNTLVEGYDRHFRNSIAHHRYTFLDREHVEMWDTNEKGKETWREQLSYEDCEEKLRQLSATISVMEAAYFLFAMNNSLALRRARGNAPVPQISLEERKDLIYVTGKKLYNLEVNGIQDDGSSLTVVTKIIPNFDIPQTSKVYIGGDSWSKAYEVPQTIEPIALNRVAFGYIRNLRRYLGEMKQLTLEIKDETGQDAGRIVMNHDQLEFVQTANDRIVAPENLPTVENTLRPLTVKFTHRGQPRRHRPEPPTILTPPEKKIILP